MGDFPRLAVRHPQPFDIVGDSFVLCGLGRVFEGVVGSARLTDGTGGLLASISPMFVAGSGSGYTLFDFAVGYGVPTTADGTLTVDADNPSGLPANDFRVTVPLTFGRPLLGSSYGGFTSHRVIAGDTLSKIAKNSYGAANLWPRLFTANRDSITDPDVIRVGQVLRIPYPGP